MGMTATADPPDTRRFTADEVWRMVEIGLLGEDEPYELLDGQLVYVSPQGEPHAKVVTRLTMFLEANRVHLPVPGTRGERRRRSIQSLT